MDSHHQTREPGAVAATASASLHLPNGNSSKNHSSQSSSKRSAMLQASAALNIALIAVLFSRWGPTEHFSCKQQQQQQLRNTQAWQGKDVKNHSDHYIAPRAPTAVVASAATDDEEDRVLCSAAAAGPRLSCSQSHHVQGCSGNGHYVLHGHPIGSQILGGGGGGGGRGRGRGACHCHACFSGPQCALVDPDCVLNLFHGDPTMFEWYWMSQPQAPTVIPAWQGMSYFAHRHNSYLFLDYHLEQAIRALHDTVGNAITQGRHIVLGVGSTQLFQAAVYALAGEKQSTATPTSIVSAIPFYSSFELLSDYGNSKNFKWAGDASKFQQTSEMEPYIEFVTSPNNPCGSRNKAVVNGTGPVVHDLAYYWPQYTPITEPADHPVMLWTISKITGHAGTRLGWAIVEDKIVADKMAMFIRHNTLGVSHESQARATTLLRTIMSSYGNSPVKGREPFFHFGQAVMENRWRRIRQALQNSSRFSLPDYEPGFCSFLQREFKPNPAYLWLHCKGEEDCHLLLQEHRILAREGPLFGVSTQYSRVSMLDREPLFDILVKRLASIK